MMIRFVWYHGIFHSRPGLIFTIFVIVNVFLTKKGKYFISSIFDRELQSCSKGKSPEVPFHGITSPQLFWNNLNFLRQFSKKQNMIKKNYQLNWTEKFVDKAQQCFAFLHIKPKFKFAVQWSWFLETNLIWATFTCRWYWKYQWCTASRIHYWIITLHRYH